MPFHDKYVHALPELDLAGRHVKPYHITLEPDGVLAAEIVGAAYAMAADLAARFLARPARGPVGDVPLCL